jgi:Flp pilus assembly protein TadD
MTLRAPSVSTKGRLEKSVEAFQRVIQLNPDAFDPLFFLGKTLGQLGRFSEAKTYLNRALKLQPNNGYIHSYLGICLANVWSHLTHPIKSQLSFPVPFVSAQKYVAGNC